MLQKLTIKNFLRNKKLSISFDKHITTIVGKSAAGKSSAIRALKWLMTNTPSGIRFINWDADEAKVILRVDKHKIVRRRSDKINSYKLDEQKPHKSFNKKVPADIENLLNISDNNFQNQGAKHFWFSLSPPEVGRQLNQIVNLESIDAALSKIGSRIRTTRAKENIHAEYVSRHRRVVSESSFIVALNRRLSSIETLKSSIDSRTLENKLLSHLISEGTTRRKLNFVAANQARDAVSAMIRFDRLRQMEFELLKLQKTLKTARKATENARRKPPNIERLSELFERCERTKKQKRKLKNLIEEAKTWRSEKQKENKRKKRGENSLRAILTNACPICGTPIKS